MLLAGCNQVFGLDKTAPRGPDAAIDAPPSSDDEDGDGFANESDNCPGVYNPDQTDQDGDLVGDVCDPHPATKGDHIVQAEYFNGPTTTWTPDTVAHWQFDGSGSYVTTGAPETTVANMTWTVVPTVTAPTLEVGITIVANTDTTPRLHFLEGDLEITNDVADCYLTTNGGTEPALDELQEIVMGSPTAQIGFSALPAGEPVLWIHTFDASGATCTFQHTTATKIGTPTSALASTVIRVTNYTISIQYALLYDFTP